ncbi:TetR-like C-terminal domain-containing protein [Marinococcus sp. PL1-022]|uniref:TetR/AcrR family transcriptional regulator n=1 Tax=Marinococcus sp. PL1-022 TaxID=3095363 RepID=UPI0029C41DB4|nr:TetR-like C-terminal domain-containing protein [Marinococcus sp. PL1-022]MDX6152704.1 TetR-like C-terminal domain-containing protein [Marinococcus sp. PL1-022]
MKSISKTDRRVKYTKAALKHSLFALMEEKSITSITVTELCKHADINRNTFYAHYRSPNELLADIEKEFTRAFIHKVEQSLDRPRYNDLMYRLCVYLEQNKSTCRALVKLQSNREDVFTRIHHYFHPRIVQKWVQENSLDYSNVDALYVFIAGGSRALIEEWVETDFQQSPEEISSMIENIMITLHKHMLYN